MDKPKSYHQKVHEITRLIPYGRVSTYGYIADYLGLGSARMVGWALNKSSLIEDGIPAHRVVNRKGELSGRIHFPSPTFMEEMLSEEGVQIQNNVIVNFKDVLWHPELLENS